MQYTQQDLQKMRERAIRGAFEMQKKAQLRQSEGKKPEPQTLPQPKPPQDTTEPQSNPQKMTQNTIEESKREQVQTQSPQVSAEVQQHPPEKVQSRQPVPQNIQTQQHKAQMPNIMPQHINEQKRQPSQTPPARQKQQQTAMPQKSPPPQKPQGAAPNQWVEKLKAAEVQRKAEEAQRKAANTLKNTGGMPHNSRKNSNAAAPNGSPPPTASGGVSGQKCAPEGRGTTPGAHNKKREERRAQEPPGCQAACPVGRVWQNRKSADTQEDSDTMLILFLVMLLMQEGAEQSLLFSLLYILL